MRVECIVSRLVVVSVPDNADDATIEALAKHEFFSRVTDLNPEKLNVEITDWADLVPNPNNPKEK